LDDIIPFEWLDKAEDLFTIYLGEYGCTAMYKICLDKMILVKNNIIFKKHDLEY